MLQTAPGLGDMELVAFQQVKYDKRDHTMKTPDPKRPDDFISISGSKMRMLARNGATPCPTPMPTDVVAANCVPPGFMVPSGWSIVVDYYQNAETKRWVPWSRPVVDPAVAPGVTVEGRYGTDDFTVYFKKDGRTISPWHDLPLRPPGTPAVGAVDGWFTGIIEIPMYTTAKLEVNKALPSNPIKQDKHDDGSARYYLYGNPHFNYGLLPQTWEDPNWIHDGYRADNDPLDIIELGSGPLPVGSVLKVKVLGALKLIDGGESDTKILVIREEEAGSIGSLQDLERVRPGTVTRLVDWLKNYKRPDGKPANPLVSDIPAAPAEAVAIIEECRARWEMLRNGTSTAGAEGFFIGRP